MIWKSQILVDTQPSQKTQSKNKQKQISNFFFCVQFYWISPLCSKYIAQDCLGKQSFGLNSAQSFSNFNFLTFLHNQSISPIFKKNIKQVSCVKLQKLMVLCIKYFAYLVYFVYFPISSNESFLELIFDLKPKINSRKLSLLLIGSFLTEVTFQKQKNIFFQKFESTQKQ